ncbi:MAG: alpha/beta hydrolase-fold protein [Planctomycetia bacterium]|nr:alpha/beta hydrolase-fold protein [Planctomycetia bacterium]
MNRLDTLNSLDLTPNRTRQVGAESGVLSTVRGSAPHTLFTPLHYEANYAYPLLVWLHGPGGDERQLKRIMPHVSLRNYVGIAPRGTSRVTASRGEQGGYDWPQTHQDYVQAEGRVFDAIQAASLQLNISPTRIFLAGFDTGGTLALRLAMAHPTQFAGVLSLGGRFPTARAPLSRLNHARQVPLFLATGCDSTEYPPEDVCADLRLFHAAGMSVALRQYQPCGHEISTVMLADMDRWMMEQINGVPATAEQT